MRFALGLPHPDDATEFADVDVVVEIAQAIEAAGLDACSVTDHPFPLLDETGTGHQAFDPFVLLACVARSTTRLGLHHHIVVLPYRNPFLVARAVGTLDRAAGAGRVILGIAAGYQRGEFAALGVDFDDRDELMDEGVVAIRQAWSGEPVVAATRHWKAAGNTMLPPPLTHPHPPLWMGGNSRRAIERAVASCDGWTPFGIPSDGARRRSTASMADFDDLRKRIGIARDTCERFNRQEPLEICLVRPPTNWAEGPPFSGAREAIDELEEMGVSWVAFRFNASSKSEMLEHIAAWGELVR